jgi:hypothetical protein
MKKANAFLLLAVTALFVVATAGLAVAGVSVTTTPQVEYGHLVIDMTTGTQTWENNPAPLAAVDIYNNTTSGQVIAVASANSSAIWGDRITTTGTGLLEQNDFTVLNAPLSAGPLLTATVVVNFLNGATMAPFGNYGTVINFGAGLPPGTFALISVTGISPASINLSTTDVLVEQQVTAMTGTASQLGVECLGAPTVGTGSNTMFINDPTTGHNGFYNLNPTGAPMDPGYRLATLEPTPTKQQTWGSVKSLYH